jgi:hypothetical protein
MDFTQFLRPDGHRRLINIQRPDAIEQKAVALLRARARLEAEILTTGEVSLTVEMDDSNGECVTLAHEIGANGPNVPGMVDILIERTFETLRSRPSRSVGDG